MGQESFVIRPGRQEQSHTDNNPPPFQSRIDASSSSSYHLQFSTPQLHAPPFKSIPSPPLLDPPPASDLLQLPGDAHSEASGLFIDNVLLNLHARTHQTGDQSHDKDSEDALEGDAAEAADSDDHGTDDFWDEEDAAIEGDVDPCEGIFLDLDLLAEEFIVEAEELGEFELFFIV